MNAAKKRHLELKHQLQLAGTSFSAIARSLGLSHTTVLTVSNGRTRSKRVELAIAKAIGQEPEAIWPEYYLDEG